MGVRGYLMGGGSLETQPDTHNVRRIRSQKPPLYSTCPAVPPTTRQRNSRQQGGLAGCPLRLDDG